MAKIVVKVFEGSFVQKFYTSHIVSQSTQSFRRPLNEKSEQYLKKLGRLGRDLVERIIKIRGVTMVDINSYEIRIEFGPAHDLETVQKSVLKVISELVFPGLDKSEIEIEIME